MFRFGQWNLIFCEKNNINAQISVTVKVSIPGHIYLGTVSSHMHVTFCLYSANYMFVELSPQLGTGISFHKINGLQVIFTSSVAPIKPGGI
jgi:hypothetical protein